MIGRRSNSAGAGFAVCRLCGKVFQTIDGDLCHKCNEKDTLKQLEIKSYLNANPDSNMSQTAADNGITTADLIKYIEDGYIQMTAGLGTEKLLSCTRCGEPISIGIMCGKCRHDFNDGVFELKKESERNKFIDRGSGMHSRHLRDGRTRR